MVMKDYGYPAQGDRSDPKQHGRGTGSEASRFEDVLARCIDDIKAGRAGLEECLQRYPSMREQLEPLLIIACDIPETPDVRPSKPFKIRARVRLMEYIHEGQAVKTRPWSLFDRQTMLIPLQRRFSMASVIAAIVITLSAVGGGAAYASQGSLPGDALYFVKLGTEQLGMILPGDDVARAERALVFADRRVQEILNLADMGRLDDLDLAVEKYDYALDTALTRIEEAGDNGSTTADLTTLVAEATIRHLTVLDEAYDQVPEAAGPAIALAMEKALAGYDRAVRILEQIGIDIPQLPEGIRQRVEDGDEWAV